MISNPILEDLKHVLRKVGGHREGGALGYCVECPGTCPGGHVQNRFSFQIRALVFQREVLVMQQMWDERGSEGFYSSMIFRRHFVPRLHGDGLFVQQSFCDLPRLFFHDVSVYCLHVSVSFI